MRTDVCWQVENAEFCPSSSPTSREHGFTSNVNHCLRTTTAGASSLDRPPPSRACTATGGSDRARRPRGRKMWSLYRNPAAHSNKATFVKRAMSLANRRGECLLYELLLKTSKARAQGRAEEQPCRTAFPCLSPRRPLHTHSFACDVQGEIRLSLSSAARAMVTFEPAWRFTRRAR